MYFLDNDVHESPLSSLVVSCTWLFCGTDIIGICFVLNVLRGIG